MDISKSRRASSSMSLDAKFIYLLDKSEVTNNSMIDPTDIVVYNDGEIDRCILCWKKVVVDCDKSCFDAKCYKIIDFIFLQKFYENSNQLDILLDKFCHLHCFSIHNTMHVALSDKLKRTTHFAPSYYERDTCPKEDTNLITRA